MLIVIPVMKETAKSLSLILLPLFILLLDSHASEFSLSLAYNQEPANHTLLAQRLRGELEGSGTAVNVSQKDITDFRKLSEILFNSNGSDEYSLHGGNRHVRDKQSTIPLHKKSDNQTSLSEDTKYLALILATTSVALYMMPEDFTNWSREGMKGTNIFERWERHIKSRPVRDGDHWAVNYIGHPYAGSAYYILARHNGLDWKEAGIYSTLISTFMWEYGVELTGEVPSIQDIIVTPIGGVMLGEILLNAEEVIIRNNGKVLGSSLLGNIALVFIDPAGSAINLIKRWTNLPSRIKIKTKPFNRSLSDYDEASIMRAEPIPFPYYGMKLVFTYE